MESNYLSDIQKSPFLFLQDHPWDYFKPISKTLNDSTSGKICDEETFYRTFMSEINRDYINLIIKKTVYNNSCDNYIVRDQKREHLEQIMKGLYNDYAQHLPFNQKEQFATLNKLVIDYCVKTILNEIDSRFKYMRDKFSPLEPLPTPINTSVTGSKSFLPTMSQVYNPALNFNTLGPRSGPAPSPGPIQGLAPGPAPSPGLGVAPDVFDQKILMDSMNSMKANLEYKPYYFTDDRTNMFARQKEITTAKNTPTRFYTADFDSLGQSYLRNDHQAYKPYVSTPAPAPVNYYIPESQQTRSRLGY